MRGKECMRVGVVIVVCAWRLNEGRCFMRVEVESGITVVPCTRVEVECEYMLIVHVEVVCRVNVICARRLHAGYMLYARGG